MNEFVARVKEGAGCFAGPPSVRLGIENIAAIQEMAGHFHVDENRFANMTRSCGRSWAGCWLCQVNQNVFALALGAGYCCTNNIAAKNLEIFRILDIFPAAVKMAFVIGPNADYFQALDLGIQAIDRGLHFG